MSEGVGGTIRRVVVGTQVAIVKGVGASHGGKWTE